MSKREKYALFTMWLKQCDQEIVKLSFSQLCEIIDIPSYAYQYRSAWANSLKPSPFEAAWLNAGFVVAGVDLLEKWVVFKRGAVKGRSLLPVSEPYIAHKFDLSSVIECGKKFYDTIKADCNHRFASWEHCYEAFKNNKQNRNDETIDFLSLHLAWYLASWGMLRNSFLFYKDYKIHVPVVRLLLDPKWKALWVMLESPTVSPLVIDGDAPADIADRAAPVYLWTSHFPQLPADDCEEAIKKESGAPAIPDACVLLAHT